MRDSTRSQPIILAKPCRTSFPLPAAGPTMQAAQGLASRPLLLFHQSNAGVFASFVRSSSASVHARPSTSRQHIPLKSFFLVSPPARIDLHTHRHHLFLLALACRRNPPRIQRAHSEPGLIAHARPRLRQDDTSGVFYNKEHHCPARGFTPASSKATTYLLVIP